MTSGYFQCFYLAIEPSLVVSLSTVLPRDDTVEGASLISSDSELSSKVVAAIATRLLSEILTCHKSVQMRSFSL